MADNSGGGNSALAFMVGALIVVVIIGGLFIFNGGFGNHNSGIPDKVSVDVNPPKPG